MAPGSFPGRGPAKNYFRYIDHKHEMQQEAAAVAVGRKADVSSLCCSQSVLSSTLIQNSYVIRSKVWTGNAEFTGSHGCTNVAPYVGQLLHLTLSGTFRHGSGTAAQFRVMRDHPLSADQSKRD